MIRIEMGAAAGGVALIGVLMGLYGRYLRPGRVGEMSLIGFVLLMAALVFPYEEFFRERQRSRYGSKTGRCC